MINNKYENEVFNVSTDFFISNYELSTKIGNSMGFDENCWSNKNHIKKHNGDLAHKTNVFEWIVWLFAFFSHAPNSLNHQQKQITNNISYKKNWTCL